MIPLRIIMAALLLGGASNAAAQPVMPAPAGADAAAGSPNPFGEPMNALSKLLSNPPAAPASVVAPPPPLAVTGPAVAAPPADERDFERLQVRYVIGEEGQLQVAGGYGGGEPAGRTYLVRHNGRAKVGSRWVVAEVANGVVSLYQEVSSTSANGKQKRSGRGQLLWSGAVDAALHADPGPGSANALTPQSYGASLSSPSQRAMSSGNALIAPTSTAK